MKSCRFQSVVPFVAICIFTFNTCKLLLPSDTAKCFLTMGLRTELRFHKAEIFFYGRRWFCLSAVSGIINKVNQLKTCSA